MGDLSVPVLPGVSSADLAQLPIERLEAELCTLAAQSASAMCRWLAMVAEFDRRDAAMQWWGVLSTAHWLAWRCAIDARTAREHVRVARAVVGLPRTMAAFAAGQLSYSKVRAITRVARISTEDTWIEKAREATTAQLEEAVRGYRRAIDPKGEFHRAQPEPDDTPADCRTRHREDGRTQIVFDLSADEAGEVLAKLDRRADSIFQDEANCGSAEPPLCLTHSERRARALLEVLSETFANTPSDPDDDRYLVVIHAEASSIGGTGRAWIEGGPPVTAERLAELLCDQPLSLLVEDDHGNPLYLGRSTKQLNRRQRRALRYRDRGCCRFPGCTRTKRINGHHVAWWRRDNGPTDIDNLVSLCPFHHRLVHRGQFCIEVEAKGLFVFARPDGTLIEDSPEPLTPARTLEHANSAAGVDVVSAPEPGDGYRQDLSLTVDALLASFGLLI